MRGIQALDLADARGAHLCARDQGILVFGAGDDRVLAEREGPAHHQAGAAPVVVLGVQPKPPLTDCVTSSTTAPASDRAASRLPA